MNYNYKNVKLKNYYKPNNKLDKRLVFRFKYNLYLSIDQIYFFLLLKTY